LGEFEEWLVGRARVFVAVAVFMELLLVFVAAQGGPLTPIALLTMVLIAALTAWTVRGNYRLARDARRLAEDLRLGRASLDKLCDLPLITAVVVYRERLLEPATRRGGPQA